MIKAQHKERVMPYEEDEDGYSESRADASVVIAREKAKQLCSLYELYRLTHDPDTAFRLAWGIEAEGLPF